jgi:hypothetical protein
MKMVHERERERERDTHRTDLDVVTLLVIRALAEETVFDSVVDVKHAEHSVGLLGELGSEDQPVWRAHLAHELVRAKTLDHVHVVHHVLNLHRHHKVQLRDHLVKNKNEDGLEQEKRNTHCYF